MKNILYFSVDEWNEIKKRPHHIAYELSKENKVYFIEHAKPPFKRFFPPYYKETEINENLITIQYNLQLPYNLTIPFQANIRINQQLIWHVIRKFLKIKNIKDFSIIITDVFSVPLRNILKDKSFKINSIVYDCFDDFIGFTGTKKFFIDLENKIIRNSKVTICAVSRYLCSNLESRAGKLVHYLPNAYDENKFKPLPSQSLKENPIILGYVGTIADWFDLADFKLFLNNPEYVLYLYGPITNNKISDEIKKKYNNVYFKGSISYDEVPKIISEFDFAIIPFNIEHKVMKGVSPIKIFEYYAMHKPIITTVWEEVYQYVDNITIYDIKKIQVFKDLNYLNIHSKNFNNAEILNQTWTNVSKKIYNLL